MAQDGIPGGGSNSGGTPKFVWGKDRERHGNEAGTDGKNDGAQPTSDAPPTKQQSNTTEALNQEAIKDTYTTPKSNSKEVKNNGQGNTEQSRPAEPSPGEGSSSPNRGRGISSDGNSSPPKTETKLANASSDGRGLSALQQPSGTSTDRTVKAPPDQAKTEVPQSKDHLIASNPYAPAKTEQTVQQSAKSEANKIPDQPRNTDVLSETSAKALDNQPGRSNSNAAQEHTQAGHSLEQQIARPQSETRASASVSEQAHQGLRSTQNDAQQASHAAQADKAPQIVAALPGIDNRPVGQAPGRANNPGEQAPAADRHEQAKNSGDGRLQMGDSPKSPNGDAKVTEATVKQTSDSPKSQPAVGELGLNESAGGGRIPHEQQSLSEAGAKPVGQTFDVAPGEQTTKDAPHKAETTAPSKEIHADTTDSLSTDKGIFIDKSKHSQIEGSKDAAIGNRPGEAHTGNRDGKQEPQPGKETSANELANKPELRTDTRMTDVAVGGSLGAGLDSRSGRDDLKAKDTSQTKEVGEVFKTLDSKPVRLDLTNKDTCKQLLDLINQIETNKFKQLDQTGRERLNLLLEVRTAALQQFKEILTAFVTKDVPVDSRAGLLLQDKLEPGSAERSKQQVDKIMELERSNSSFKQIVSRVSEAFNQFLKVFSAPNIEPAKEIPDAQGLVTQLTESDDPMRPEVREFVITMKEILPRDIGSLDMVDVTEEALDVDDTPAVTNSKKVNPSGHSREQYLVQDKDTPKSIALKCFNNEALWQLIWDINKPEATYSDINDKIRNRDFLAGDLIHLPTYIERQEFLEPKGAPHESS